MKKKIDSSIYENKFSKIFGTSPLTYNDIEVVVDEIKKIKEEAFEIFKERKFYESACFYKALLDQVLKYLTNVNDKEGKLNDVVYEFIRYFSESCKNSNEIDKIDFFEKSLQLYIEEELGFTDEVTQLIINNIKNEEEEKITEEKILEKINDKKVSKYNQNKVIELLLKIYRKFNNLDKYIEACKLMSIDRWERYIKPSEIYESLGEWENALRIIEEGIKELPKYKDVFLKRKEEIQNRILGY